MTSARQQIEFSSTEPFELKHWPSAEYFAEKLRTAVSVDVGELDHNGMLQISVGIEQNALIQIAKEMAADILDDFIGKSVFVDICDDGIKITIYTELDEGTRGRKLLVPFRFVEVSMTQKKLMQALIGRLQEFNWSDRAEAFVRDKDGFIGDLSSD